MENGIKKQVYFDAKKLFKTIFVQHTCSCFFFFTTGFLVCVWTFGKPLMCMFLKYVLNSILMNCLKSPIITFTLQMKELNVRELNALF